MADQSLRVLLIDDDESVVTTLGRILTLQGYEVATALNVEAGLSQVDQFRPDVVLLDLRMPLVGGLIFLRCLRARGESGHTPVAIVTGDYFIDEAVAAEIRSLGADLHFKPLWLDDVIGITERLLHRRRQPPAESG